MNESAELSAASADRSSYSILARSQGELATLLPTPARRTGRERFTSWFGRLARIRSRAAARIFRADALPQELDRGSLQRAHPRGARSRDRRRRVDRIAVRSSTCAPGPRPPRPGRRANPTAIDGVPCAAPSLPDRPPRGGQSAKTRRLWRGLRRLAARPPAHFRVFPGRPLQSARLFRCPARRRGRAGEPPAFSPLYVHAAVGLGKTHLLQAIAHAAAAQGRSVIYLTAERFMYGFVAALQSQTAIAFKEALRSIDMLDLRRRPVPAGQGDPERIRPRAQRADRLRPPGGRRGGPPAERSRSLDERVRSRLAGGLCVEMSALDEPLRVKILEARIAAARAPKSALLRSRRRCSPIVARSIISNGRDLEGAVNRLLAHRSSARR